MVLMIKFYVYDDTVGNNTDVTPIVSTTTFTSVFSTQSGSQLVEISSTDRRDSKMYCKHIVYSIEY